MPINLPNFLSAPLPRGPQYTPDYSGIANFIPQALQAYRAPFEMQEKRQMNLADIQKKHMENALLKEFGAPEKRADMAYKMAQIQNLLGPQTQTQKDIAAIYPPGSPEYVNALKNQLGIPTEEDYSSAEKTGISKDLIGGSFSHLNSYGQEHAMKGLESKLDQAVSKKHAMENINEIEKLANDNPHLWKSIALVMRTPMENEGELKKFIKANNISQKDATIIDYANKLSGELVFDIGAGFGRNFSDAKMFGLQQIKPHIGMTPESITKMKKHFEKTLGYADAEAAAYRWGIQNRKYIINNPESFRKMQSQMDETRKLEQNPGATRTGVQTQAAGSITTQGLVKGLWTDEKGAQHEIELVPEDVEEFKKDGGVIIGG